MMWWPSAERSTGGTEMPSLILREGENAAGNNIDVNSVTGRKEREWNGYGKEMENCPCRLTPAERSHT